MPTSLDLGLRNVFRHPRRTVITAAAVALGVVFMTVAAGFLDFTFSGLRQSIVYSGLGHVQLLPRGDDGRARLSAELVDGARRYLRADPAVEHVTARLELQGLVSAGPRTVTFSGVGVEARTEAQIRSLTMLAAGEWFSGVERMPRVLVGSGLASRLQLHPRDLASLITYSDRGRLSAVEVQVAGIFESGVIEYDARTLILPLATAQELLETPAFGSLAVTVHDAAATAAIADGLGRWLSTHGADARVARWDELSPVYGSVVNLYRWILDVFLVIIAIVVVLGIANTMSMAVLERVAEIGVLRALGFSAGRVMLMFLVEAAAIGVLGATTGLVLGAASCLGISSLGIDMPPPPGHSQGYVAEVHIVPAAFAVAATIAIVAAVLAGVGPSLRAVRREVSDVLRAT
jgi:putative ABC transport system permease protein